MLICAYFFLHNFQTYSTDNFILVGTEAADCQAFSKCMRRYSVAKCCWSCSGLR